MTIPSSSYIISLINLSITECTLIDYHVTENKIFINYHSEDLLNCFWKIKQLLINEDIMKYIIQIELMYINSRHEYLLIEFHSLSSYRLEKLRKISLLSVDI